MCTHTKSALHSAKSFLRPTEGLGISWRALQVFHRLHIPSHFPPIPPFAPISPHPPPIPPPHFPPFFLLSHFSSRKLSGPLLPAVLVISGPADQIVSRNTAEGGGGGVGSVRDCTVDGTDGRRTNGRVDSRSGVGTAGAQCGRPYPPVLILFRCCMRHCRGKGTAFGRQCAWGWRSLCGSVGHDRAESWEVRVRSIVDTVPWNSD